MFSIVAKKQNKTKKQSFLPFLFSTLLRVFIGLFLEPPSFQTFTKWTCNHYVIPNLLYYADGVLLSW